jgi:hypothetical protein
MEVLSKIEANYKQFILSFDNYWNQVEEKLGFWHEKIEKLAYKD